MERERSGQRLPAQGAQHRREIGLDPDVYGLYAFRHTSITRMLLAGTHTAIVAKCHDTSEAMIRKHYAASILDYTDEITRKTLPAFGPARLPRATSFRWRNAERCKLFPGGSWSPPEIFPNPAASPVDRSDEQAFAAASGNPPHANPHRFRP